MSEISIEYIVPLRILSGKRIWSSRHLDNQVKIPRPSGTHYNILKYTQNRISQYVRMLNIICDGVLIYVYKEDVFPSGAT